MRLVVCDIGGRSACSLLSIAIACALLVADGAAKAESGARRDCLDHAKDGPAIEYRRNLEACKSLKPAGQRKPAPRDVQDLPGAAVEELLALVRSFNPELAAAALDREAAVAKIYPAGALDDPMVNLSRDQGFRQTLLTVSQDFPLWGKREVRQEIAAANANAARGREGGVTSDLQEQVKMVFAQYYQAEQSIRVTQSIRAILRDVSASARARYAQGLGNQSDAIRAELEQTRIDPELSGLERDEQAAKAKINALIGRSADAPLAPPKTLRRVPPAPSLRFDELMARARGENPTLATARAEIAAAEGERTLVGKSWYPDVTVTVGTTDLPNMSPRATGGIGIKVPLQWGVREAQTREATAKKGAAQLRLDAARLKIGSELQSALADLTRSQHNEDVLEHALKPQSEAVYRSTLASYQQGRGDLAPVLDAARQRLQIGIELLRARTEAQTALATIERLIGGDL
jgi:cobalt-zinc-cadmium efflux system outer membrane protein